MIPADCPILQRTARNKRMMLNMNHMLIRIPLRRSEAFSTENKKPLHFHDERFLL